MRLAQKFPKFYNHFFKQMKKSHFLKNNNKLLTHRQKTKNFRIGDSVLIERYNLQKKNGDYPGSEKDQRAI